MKKLLSLSLASVLALSALPAHADLYRQHQPNDTTFETMEELRVNAPEWINSLYPLKNLIPDPALEEYPEGTTYVYRSAGMFDSDTAADRMNTNILVYTDKAFADKDEALSYLKEMNLTDLVDAATGSIVLVTPINPEAGFGEADQNAYYLLQAVMCNINAMKFGPTGIVSYAEPGYFGGVTFRYLIGIDGGATFVNNYVSTQLDFVGRLAGMLLVGGEMEKIRDVATVVPVCLVNPEASVLARYEKVNEVNATEETPVAITSYNDVRPLQRVAVIKNSEISLADAVAYAYDNLFTKAQRIPTIKAGLYTAAQKYSDHNFNQAPYSLCARNAIINGKTADGLLVVEHQEDRFSDLVASNGEYLTTWYEVLPEEVADNTAPAKSIPLVLAIHGGGDDPLQAVDNLGLTALAGEERIAVVAPRTASDVPGAGVFSPSPYEINGQTMPALVKYMLETYPALDPARVYVTGYSMGGSATIQTIAAAPELFAAAVPMAAATPVMTSSYVPTDEEAAAFANVDIPIMFMTSTYDLPACVNQAAGTLGQSYMDHINRFLGFNEMAQIDYDFDTYDFVGFEADKLVTRVLNNEFINRTWTLNREDGAPMVGVSYTEGLPHGLYPEYVNLFWDYVKHFSRNTETGEIIYR